MSDKAQPCGHRYGCRIESGMTSIVIGWSSARQPYRRGIQLRSKRPRSSSRVMMPSMTLRKPSTARSEEHTSELQSLMRISYAVFCLNKTKNTDQEVVNTD